MIRDKEVAKLEEQQNQKAGLISGYQAEINKETARQTPLAAAAAVAKQEADTAKSDYAEAAFNCRADPIFQAPLRTVNSP
jgi:predicted phage gp36 major capsid-like protein